MGNANGREDGGSENGDGGGGDDELLEASNHAPTAARVASADLMASSPPHDPRQSRSPLLFSSQVRFSFLLMWILAVFVLV